MKLKTNRNELANLIDAGSCIQAKHNRLIGVNASLAVFRDKDHPQNRNHKPEAGIMFLALIGQKQDFRLARHDFVQKYNLLEQAEVEELRDYGALALAVAFDPVFVYDVGQIARTAKKPGEVVSFLRGTADVPQGVFHKEMKRYALTMQHLFD